MYRVTVWDSIYKIIFKSQTHNVVDCVSDYRGSTYVHAYNQTGFRHHAGIIIGNTKVHRYIVTHDLIVSLMLSKKFFKQKKNRNISLKQLSSLGGFVGYFCIE